MEKRKLKMLDYVTDILALICYLVSVKVNNRFDFLSVRVSWFPYKIGSL